MSFYPQLPQTPPQYDPSTPRAQHSILAPIYYNSPPQNPSYSLYQQAFPQHISPPRPPHLTPGNNHFAPVGLFPQPHNKALEIIDPNTNKPIYPFPNPVARRLYPYPPSSPVPTQVGLPASHSQLTGGDTGGEPGPTHAQDTHSSTHTVSPCDPASHTGLPSGNRGRHEATGTGTSSHELTGTLSELVGSKKGGVFHLCARR